MVEILENRDEWEANFRDHFVAHLQETGQTNFKLYSYASNVETPGVAGVDVSHSRLMLLSTAGGYIAGEQEPFDAADLIGDYTIRRLTLSTPLGDISFVHDHYDHQFVNEDVQSVLPLRHLETLVRSDEIGELAPEVISIMGYQTDAVRVVDEVIPQILDAAHEQKAQAVLLAPV